MRPRWGWKVRLPLLLHPEAARTGSCSLVSLSAVKVELRKKPNKKKKDLWMDLWVTVARQNIWGPCVLVAGVTCFLCSASLPLLVPLVFLVHLDEPIVAFTCIQMSQALHKKKKKRRHLVERLLQSIQVWKHLKLTVAAMLMRRRSPSRCVADEQTG